MLVRQARRKQSTLGMHPSASLHLIQLSKLVQDYQHARMVYQVNLNAAVAMSILPEIQLPPQPSFNISLDVPYIQSEHYESNNSFTEDLNAKHLSSQQNFTDQDEQEKPDRQKNRQQQIHRKVVQFQQQEQFKEEDFQFVARNTNCSSHNNSSFPINSTKLSDNEKHSEQEIELSHLQETAYFSQAPDPRQVERRLSYGSEYLKENQFNMANKSQIFSGCSKKAIFLNKIEKERSRKEIAQLINRERHHIKRFLK